MIRGYVPYFASPVAFMSAPDSASAYALASDNFTALARSYDFFVFWFTLALTPMVLLSGVFYPVENMHPALQAVSQLLPLTHAVQLTRPLLLGQVPGDILLHVVVLLGYGVAGLAIAMRLFKKRLLS